MYMADLSTINHLDVTVLVDNVADSTTTENIDMIESPFDWSEHYRTSKNHLQATHGFSVIVDAFSNNRKFRTLYDTGSSSDVLQNNMKILGIDPNSIEEIVISHGHWDHFGGLLWLLEQIENEVPVYLHERMLYKRGVRGKFSIRELGKMPDLSEIEEAGGQPILESDPRLIAGGNLLISGSISRTSKFETGFPNHLAYIDGSWVDDSQVLDDRCLIANISDKGLVVISGCSHAGIINMLHQSMKLTGVNQIYGILGGLHLIGKDSERRTHLTVQELFKISPTYIVPGHCTGWNAKLVLARDFPKSILGLSVGNRYLF
jgi:7,8-dihydropterin-6-yl-methyl-4-(beta-D-ribofuranosyl)aminobenzene 5'-phosphate synthase